MAAPAVAPRGRGLLAASALLEPAALPLADASVVVCGATYPAHRAVLALHSVHFHALFFRAAASPASAAATRGLLDAGLTGVAGEPAAGIAHTESARGSGAAPLSRLALSIDGLPDELLHAGWRVAYDRMYEAEVGATAGGGGGVGGGGAAVSVETLAAAFVFCTVYRFDDLAASLEREVLAAISPTNCTSVLATVDSWGRFEGLDWCAGIRRSCVNTIKARFADVSDWGALDARQMTRMLKLNDLGDASQSEELVFWAVSAWVAAKNGPPPDPATWGPDPADAEGQARERASPRPYPRPPPTAAAAADDPALGGPVSSAVVESLVKLIRFPTIPRSAAAAVTRSSLVREYPGVEKYVAQISRAPRRHITVETSPLFRPRRPNVLTFADRVSSFSRVSGRMQTSARYFGNCLWHLVVGRRDGFVELYLGALSEEDDGELNVELDFTLYIAQMDASSLGNTVDEPPPMIRREVKRAVFTRNGQRIGFRDMISLDDVPDFARNDMLCIGASLRLRGCRERVDAIDDLVDHSADAVSC